MRVNTSASVELFVFSGLSLTGPSLQNRTSTKIVQVRIRRRLRYLNLLIARSANSESMWCTAIRYGSQSEWTFAWNITRHPHTQLSERRKMLKAMSCTTDSTRIKKLLARVLHPNIKQDPKETSLIFNRLILNPSARPNTLNFLLSNWGFLEKQ